MMYQALCTEFYDADKKFADEDEINFYKKFLKKNDVILEPMCGSGRLLIPFLQQGYTVHGIDNSIAMLKSCKDRAAKLDLHPALFEEAIETMSLPNQYNIILIALGSFQLLYPRSSAFNALQNFKKHLLPKGKLILDMFIPWDALYENNEEEVSEKEVIIPEGIIKHQSHSKANKQEQFYYSESVYTKIINNKIVAEEKEQMHVSWYYRYEMELILEKYGFKNIECREEFFRNENHMIFIAENA